MRVPGRLFGEKGLAVVPALLLPLGRAAWAHAWASVYAWANLWISKNAWNWAFGGLSKSAAHSLDNAILVIGLPPVFFFVALFFYVRSRSKSWRGEREAVSASATDPSSRSRT